MSKPVSQHDATVSICLRDETKQILINSLTKYLADRDIERGTSVTVITSYFANHKDAEFLVSNFYAVDGLITLLDNGMIQFCDNDSLAEMGRLQGRVVELEAKVAELQEQIDSVTKDRDDAIPTS